MRHRYGLLVFLAVAGACSAFGDDDLTGGAPDGGAQDATTEGGSVVDAGGEATTLVEPDADAMVDAGPPVCPAVGTPDVIFVDAESGADTNDGKSNPFRSITHGIAEARKASTPQTICVRGGAVGGAPKVYSEASGEAFPLYVDVIGLTLLGEGKDRVTISYLGTAPDGGLGTAYSPNGQAILVDKGDVTIAGLTVEVLHADAINGNGAGLKITDSHFETTSPNANVGSLVSSLARVSLERVTMKGNRSFGNCLTAVYAQLNVTDSSLSDCRNGLYASYNELSYLKNVSFRGHESGIWHLGDGLLQTEGCTFDSCGAGISLRPDGLNFRSWTSTNDTFVRNGTGLLVYGLVVDGGPIPQGRVNGASFKTHTGAGIQLDYPMQLVVRGSTFEDGTGPAVQVNEAGVPYLVDVGAEDGGPNTLQSGSHPNNGGGVCNLAAGTVLARGSRFAHCPPQEQVDRSCAGNTDVGGGPASAVDSTGCVVAP